MALRNMDTEGELIVGMLAGAPTASSRLYGPFPVFGIEPRRFSVRKMRCKRRGGKQTDAGQINEAGLLDRLASSPPRALASIPSAASETPTMVFTAPEWVPKLFIGR